MLLLFEKLFGYISLYVFNKKKMRSARADHISEHHLHSRYNEAWHRLEHLYLFDVFPLRISIGNI